MRWSVGTSSRVPKPVVGEVINLRLVTSHWAIEHAHRTQLLLALVHIHIHFGQMCRSLALLAHVCSESEQRWTQTPRTRVHVQPLLRMTRHTSKRACGWAGQPRSRLAAADRSALRHSLALPWPVPPRPALAALPCSPLRYIAMALAAACLTSSNLACLAFSHRNLCCSL